MKIVFLFVLMSNLTAVELDSSSTTAKPQQMPIYEIDREEAEYYRFFSEIDSFTLARFYENNESIQVVILFIVNGDTIDSAVNISRGVFEGLKFYQKNFHRIITDLNFRKDFLKNYEIDWPLISLKKFSEYKNRALSRAIFNSLCCITGTGAAGAYIGALMGRSIYKQTGYIPCGYQEYSCTIPYEYYSYTIDHTKYYTGIIMGVAGGAVASKEIYLKNHKKNILFNLLPQDIVAFDDNGTPITLKEVDKENKGLYTAGFGTLGIVIGSTAALIGMVTLSRPWFDLVPKTQWDDNAVTIPIYLISGIGFYYFVKFAFEKGEELDRIATIERIKMKRNKIDTMNK